MSMETVIIDFVNNVNTKEYRGFSNYLSLVQIEERCWNQKLYSLYNKEFTYMFNYNSRPTPLV